MRSGRHIRAMDANTINAVFRANSALANSMNDLPMQRYYLA